MATTEDRLAALAQRRTRPAAPAAAGREGTRPSTALPDRTASPPGRVRRGRRKSAAPLTRILVTGASVSAVLAGAGFLALADQAVSATSPSASQGAPAPTAALAGGAPTPPVNVVVVTRHLPPAAPGAAQAAVAPTAAPTASPLGAAAPKAAVVAAPSAAPPAPVTTTKKS